MEENSLLPEVPYIYYYSMTEKTFFGISSKVNGVRKVLTLYEDIPDGCKVCPSYNNTLQNNITLYFHVIDPVTNWPSENNITFAENYTITSRPWYQNVENQTFNGLDKVFNVWTNAYTFPGVLDTVGITLSRPIFSSIGELLGIIAIDMVFSSLTENLKQLKLTENGFAYIIDKTGKLIGSTSHESVYNNSSKILKRPSQMSDESINLTGLFLESILTDEFNQKYTEVQDFDFSVLGQFRNFEVDNKIYFQLEQIPNRSPLLIIVNGALKSDYVGNITLVEKELSTTLSQSTSKIVLIAVAIFCFVLTLSLVGTYFWVIKPLQLIVVIMDQVR
ncbi:hypothetical protein HK099_006182 [Clydaea vesicula]|uniref:Cache domain-containing protein n=1 Tax=Clydaea vesicula TaxID=447962 RepID=A0AAD5TZC3_9FUNG|nr:hypothetical protein HK099_006182 [Clydaea vesicula]